MNLIFGIYLMGFALFTIANKFSGLGWKESLCNGIIWPGSIAFLIAFWLSNR